VKKCRRKTLEGNSFVKIMTSVISASRTIIVNPTKKHTATFFFFHGSGSSGSDVETWLSSLTSRKLTFPHIKIVYPSAPSQPYTAAGGLPSNVWFDRSAIAISAPEKKSSLDSMCNAVSDLIDKEIASGVPLNRIVIGGFSMGGALALHVAYRFKKTLAGCVAMSSFLNNNSLVYEALKIEGGQNTPPLLQFHGSSDGLVPFKWGVTTHNTLKSLGVRSELVPLEGVDHELVATEVEHLKEWLLNIVPETP